MITLATCFTVTRLGIRCYKRRFWLIEDVTVCLAWACFTAMSIGYICVTPAVYRIAAVGNGEIAPYPTLKQDSEYLVKIFFPNTLLLWTTLWLVKFALLLQCRRLVDRLPTHIRIWKCIVGFAALVYVGCVISEFTSCRSLHDWFTFGMCQTERDARASVISLFYSFAVDIVTDLMIMLFPLPTLWKLKMSPLRKYSIMAIFGVGTICIVTSIVRVAQIRSKSGSKQPSPSWLELWAMVEAAVAVVVACLPSFGLLLPSVKPSRAGYSSSFSQSKSGHRHKLEREGIALRSRSSHHGLHEPVIEGNASRERLKTCSRSGVLVTTTLNVEEPPDAAEGCSYHKTTLPEHQACQIV